MNNTTNHKAVKNIHNDLYSAQSQSRIQSPQALWPAVVRQEKLWGTGILLLQDVCSKTMQAVTEQPINFFSNSLGSLLATYCWSKSLRSLVTRLAPGLRLYFSSDIMC